MKKIILTALAALLVAVPAVQAQKVNKAALLDKIAKSDADIADAKKGAKAATWMNRGKAFYDATVEPTKNVFVGMERAMMKLAMGEPSSIGEEKGAEAWVYPYVTVFVDANGGKVTSWRQTDWVLKEAPQKAVEAYNKAYEIDPKTASKVKDGLKQVCDYFKQLGDISYDLGDYAVASDAYGQAYGIQTSPAYGEGEPLLLYYAGYMSTVDGSSNAASFAKGADYLNKAIEAGYTDEQGMIYYYLFHCYYGQKEADAANLQKAKEVLLDGIGKFPKNEKILEGLMQLYTVEKGVGDPADLVALIDKSIADNPENADLWFGRGRIFYALKNYEECIASFKKVVDLKPDMFESNYYLGLFYVLKGDAENEELNNNYNDYGNEAYEEMLKKIDQTYMEAVPWLEKAYQLKTDFTTLEMLKQLSFKLRDYEGMMDKYNYYNPLYQEAKAQQEGAA